VTGFVIFDFIWALQNGLQRVRFWGSEAPICDRDFVVSFVLDTSLLVLEAFQAAHDYDID
jgi:hypothetical protein